MPDFIAQKRIARPGTYVAGYQAGDPVPAQVVKDWELVVGDDGDVQIADDYQAPRPVEDSNDRASWEAYVVGQGTTLEDARAASLPELRGMYPAPPAPETPAWQVNDATGGATPVTAAVVPTPSAAPEVSVERPADNALKAEWVEYVVQAGGNSDWARDPSTKKDDLMAWEPGRNG